MTLTDLAETVIAVTRSDSKIVFSSLPIDDPKVRQPDVARATELLGWEPTVALAEGLRRVVEFERNNRSHSLTALG